MFIIHEEASKQGRWPKQKEQRNLQIVSYFRLFFDVSTALRSQTIALIANDSELLDDDLLEQHLSKVIVLNVHRSEELEELLESAEGLLTAVALDKSK